MPDTTPAKLTATQAAQLTVIRDQMGGHCKMVSADQPGLTLGVLRGLETKGYLTYDNPRLLDLTLTLDGLNALTVHEAAARRAARPALNITPTPNPVKPACEVDWESIAVRLAWADGSFHLLSTRERDVLEAAMDAHTAAQHEADQRADQRATA
jgi:hypothetical protein